MGTASSVVGWGRSRFAPGFDGPSRSACVLIFALALVACGGPDPGDGEGSDSPGPVPTAAEASSSTRGRGGIPEFERTVADRPVLLVTIDTLRWDALGSYGAATPTPALDALAADGVRFEHAVAHAVVTLPSHASILTGLDPSRHGVHDNDGYRLDDGLTTWAERMRSAGYATGAFVGAFPVDSLFGLAQGFDVYDDHYGAGASTGSLQMVERTADAVVGAARRWLGRQGGSPWFAWVHVYDPHAPYAAPAPYGDRYADDPYAGEVAWVDHALEPLLREARERDAIVVVTSDHGEALGDHGEETHGVFAYAATLRVPLVVAGLPGVEPGTVVPDRVRHVDVLPTVLAALGLDSAGIQGVSLAGVLQGRAHPDDASYFEALTPYLDWGWAPLRGMYAGPLKYIDLPIQELYDVAEDPEETENLIEKRAADARRIEDRLDRHLAVAAEADADEAEPRTEDAETLRRLRALGYMGGADRSRGQGDFGPEDDPKRLIPLEGELQRAVRAMEAGRLEEAVATLRDVIEIRPGFSRAYTVLAAARERQSGPLAAVRELEEALDRGAETPYLLGRLGHYYQLAGRLGDAARVVRRALEARPDDAEMLAQLATIHAELGRPAEAEGLLERALALDPTYARLHANKGTLLLQTGRPAAAAESFRRALEYDDTLAEAHNGLGVLAYQYEGDLDQAVEHWRAVLRHEPYHRFALSNLGLALVRLERYGEAIEVLEEYVQLEPGDEDARETLRRLRRDHGR